MKNKKKQKKSKGPQKPIVEKSRKEKRKELRKSKKQQKNLHFHRSKTGHEKTDEQQQHDEVPQPKASTEAIVADKLKKESLKLEKLKKDQMVQRKKRLLEANIEEEKNLKRLEKQLGLKKSKKNKSGVAKVFVQDGLDFLLDVCDGLPEDHREEEEDMQLSSDENEEEEDEPVELEEELEVDKEELDSDMDQGEEESDLEDESGDQSDDVELEEVEEEEKEDESEKNQPETLTEDIYGNQRNAKGEIVHANKGQDNTKYIPPALRARMESANSDDQERKVRLEKLKKKLKGLLNRLASSNIGSIAKEIEGVYYRNSRNDLNDSLFQLFKDSLLASIKTPERLIMEHALLVGILHCNIGVEVGGFFLQEAVTFFHEKYLTFDERDFEDKTLDNVAVFIANLNVFRVFGSDLLFDLLDLFIETFETGKDIELILLLLRIIGFGLRKDNPSRLKETIMSLQRKCKDNKKFEGDSRLAFMMETVMAIKNNNVKKIPNYDNEHQQFLLKNMKQFVKSSSDSHNVLSVSLSDILNAETKGRWWIVGSAWSGKSQDPITQQETNPIGYDDHSSELMDLAKKMRMNTETRRNIFCTVMAAEDFIDAFEKLVKMPIKSQKEREVTFVLLDCCLQEKRFNPYYVELMTKLANFERKYRMACQFALWDRIRVLSELKKFQVSNLAEFTFKIIANGTLSLNCLKVVEFAEMDKFNASYLKSVLLKILLLPGSEISKTFQTLAGHPKSKLLRDGLGLFMRQFILKDTKIHDSQDFEKLKQNVYAAEIAMTTTYSS